MSRFILSLLALSLCIISGTLGASVIVDDRDGSVTPSGQWSQSQGQLQEYLQTNSQSVTPGSTLTLNFQGTGAAVFATVGYGNATALSFSIDGGTATSYTSPVVAAPALPSFHSNLFSVDNLADASHTLVITVVSAGESIFIDYFLVVPGSDADLAGKTLFCDDTDTEIQYSGTWSDGGTVQDVQATLHEADQGASATLVFDGTGVIVYGSIPQGASGSAVTFAMDGASQTFTVPGSLSFDAGVASNTQLFSASGLPAGIHSLQMTAQAGGVFNLDYLTISGFVDPSALSSVPASTPFVEVTTPSNPPPPSSSLSGSSGSSTPSTAISTTTSTSVSATSTTQTLFFSFGLPSAPTTSSPPATSGVLSGAAFSSVLTAGNPLSTKGNTKLDTDDASSSHSAMMIGSIAGGALALLVASTIFIWLCLRRRSRARARRFHQLGDEGGYGSTSSHGKETVHPAFASQRTSLRSYSDHGRVRSVRLSGDTSAFPVEGSYLDFSGPSSSMPLVTMIGGNVGRSPSHVSLIHNVETVVTSPARPSRPVRPSNLNISLSRATTVNSRTGSSSRPGPSSYHQSLTPHAEYPPSPTTASDVSDVKLPIPEEVPATSRPLPQPPQTGSGLRLLIPRSPRQTWASDDILPAYTPR